MRGSSVPSDWRCLSFAQKAANHLRNKVDAERLGRVIIPAGRPALRSPLADKAITEYDRSPTGE
jgi:hypothetical protein